MFFGLGMLEAEMMMGMGMGMGMGMRRGMYGGGGQTVIICQPGCTGACCMNRNMCMPGCVGPCCINRNAMMNQNYLGVQGQMMPMGGAMQMGANGQIMQYPQNGQMMMQSPQNGQIVMQRGPNGQMIPVRNMAVQNIPVNANQTNNCVQARQVVTPQRQPNIQQNMYNNNVIPDNERGRIQQIETKQAVKQKVMINQQIVIDQQFQRNANTNNTYNPVGNVVRRQVNRDPSIIYQGDIYQKSGGKWNLIKDAILNAQTFINIYVRSIEKIKIKSQSQVNGTKIIKITAKGKDQFFSIAAEQQVQLMMRITWAKLCSMGVTLEREPEFNGRVQGPILRKNFFGGWEANYGAVSGQIFKISAGNNLNNAKAIGNVPQIWTRFQLVNGNLLQVKMHHGGSKLQIAVPIDKGLIWLRALYNIIRQ